MICTGSLHSARFPEARSARHHQSPVSAGASPCPTHTRENTASNPLPRSRTQKSNILHSAGANCLCLLQPVRPSALSAYPCTSESSWFDPATYHSFHLPSL